MEFFEILSFLLIYVLLPASGIALVVYLILLVKQMTSSLKSMDKITTDLEHKLALLDEPIENIVNISDTIIKAWGVATSVFTGFSAFTSKRKNKRNGDDY